MRFRLRDGAAFIAIIATAAVLAACAASPGKVTRTKPVAPLNTHGELAVKGYDPVAYFTEHKPTVGSAQFEYQWQGARWRFANSANRDAFVQEPTRYAPQFGGYCAFAVSRGTVADVDPDQWAVVDGRLYLNNNAFAQSLWNQDRPGNIAAGTLNWPLIPKKGEALLVDKPADSVPPP